MTVTPPAAAPMIEPSYWSYTTLGLDRPGQPQFCQRFSAGRLNCRRVGQY